MRSQSSAYRMRTMITVCTGLNGRSNTSTTRWFSSRLLATSRQKQRHHRDSRTRREKIGSGHHRRWLARTAATRMAVVLTLRGALSAMRQSPPPDCLRRAIGYRADQVPRHLQRLFHACQEATDGILVPFPVLVPGLYVERRSATAEPFSHPRDLTLSHGTAPVAHSHR